MYLFPLYVEKLAAVAQIKSLGIRIDTYTLKCFEKQRRVFVVSESPDRNGSR